MNYLEQLMRLADIITADDSTNAQRKAARSAKTRLIDGPIEEVFARFQNRTQEFNVLGSVVGRIASNQLTGIIDTLDTVVRDVQIAAEGPKPDDEADVEAN
jgi:hypothetical protein